MPFNPTIIYHTKYVTTDNLVPGDFVVAYNYSAGEIRVKKAVVNPYQINIGFVRTAYNAGMEIYLYALEFINDKLSGLVVGDFYYAHPTIPGAVTNVMPTGVFMAQRLGKAISPTKLDTRYNELIYIGSGVSPTGLAGGDLIGTYPNPGVNWANGLPVYDLQYYPLTLNPAGYITSAALVGYLTTAAAALTYYPIPTGTTSQYIRGDGSLDTFPTIPSVTPSALTKVDDTNVTLTLGGTPSTALLQAVSLTLGWTGTLADSRIASASTWNAKQNALSGTGIVVSTAGVISYIAGLASQFVKADGSLDSSVYLTTISGLNISLLTNDTGYITSAALSGYLTSATAASTYVPLTRNLTINGTTFDLSADRTWSVGTVTSVSGTTPISSSGGTTPAISIANAVADGTTKGAATFTASDFNDDGSGLISIDYTNGQAASGSTKGFLTSADWTTFNSKLSPATAASTYVELAGDTMTGLLEFSGTTHAGIKLNNLTTAQRNALTPSSGMLVLDTDLDEFCHYNGAGWEYELNKAVASNVTTNVVAAANITGLSFSVEANSTFLISGYYQIGCSGVGGVKFTQTGPAGSTFEFMYDGTTNTGTANLKARSVASGTLTASSFNTVASQTGLNVRGFLRTSGTAGTLQMQFASNTNGQTSTVYAYSWVRITRIA